MNIETNVARDTPRDADAIERQNEEIRADMDKTLEALERKLSPGQLLDQALQLVKEHGGGLASNLGTAVKQNPMPVLLTAVGLVWMMSAQRRGSLYQGRDRREAYGSADEPDTASVADTAREWKETTGERIDEARSRVRATAERVSDKASAVGDRLRGATATVKQSARSAVERGRHAKESVQSMLEEQPLVLAAIGVGVGALLGSALPETRTESRLMGPARDRALKRARELGETQYQRVRETVTRATEGAKQAVSEEQQRPH